MNLLCGRFGAILGCILSLVAQNQIIQERNNVIQEMEQCITEDQQCISKDRAKYNNFIKSPICRYMCILVSLIFDSTSHFVTALPYATKIILIHELSILRSSIY